MIYPSGIIYLKIEKILFALSHKYFSQIQIRKKRVNDKKKLISL